MGRQQAFHTLSKRFVAAACLQQVGAPLLGGQASGLRKQHRFGHRLLRRYGFQLGIAQTADKTRHGHRSSSSRATLSQALAYAQTRSASRGEMPSSLAASSSVQPAKYRSLTSSALAGACSANR